MLRLKTTYRGVRYGALAGLSLRYPAVKTLMLALLWLPGLLLAQQPPPVACQASVADQTWVNGFASRVLANDEVARGLRAAAGNWMLCEGRVTGKEDSVLLGTFRLLWSGGLELRVTKWSVIGSDLEIRAPAGTLDLYRILDLAAQAFERDGVPISLPIPFQPQPLGYVEVSSTDSEVPGLVRIEHDQAGRITRFLWRIGDRAPGS